MKDSAVKIEVHLIQNFAPSNLNRDDTGQPKSAYFGGFRRARVSSQCGKRAVRSWWLEKGTVPVGTRTKRLQQMLAEKLDQDEEFKKKVPAPEERKLGIRVFTEAYYAASDKKKPESTNVLMFIGPEEVQACVEAIKALWDDKPGEAGEKKGKKADDIKGIASIAKELQVFEAKSAKMESASADGEDPANNAATGEKIKSKRPKLATSKEIETRIESAKISADIALFGRMLAEKPGRNTDGACQFSHPISTHKVDMEMDFYTAVDDLNPAEETGAGMMGVIGFNSACYYRYALVDRDQLARNLSRKTNRDRSNSGWTEKLEADDYGKADEVIKAFLEAMVFAIPTGKQNSFAAQNPPSFGLFIRRQSGVPISLSNAFAKPVRPVRSDDDLIGLSVGSLTTHWNELKKVYGQQGVNRLSFFHVGQEKRLNGLELVPPRNKTNENAPTPSKGGQAASKKNESLSVEEAIRYVLETENDVDKNKDEQP